jgi:hypothetical protein
MSNRSHQSENFTRLIEMTPRLRLEIEATIERLIALLDLYDGDETLEVDDPDEDGGDDEPSLGWTDMQSRINTYGDADRHHYFLGYNRELDDCDDEDCDGISAIQPHGPRNRASRSSDY